MGTRYHLPASHWAKAQQDYPVPRGGTWQVKLNVKVLRKEKSKAGRSPLLPIPRKPPFRLT